MGRLLLLPPQLPASEHFSLAPRPLPHCPPCPSRLEEMLPDVFESLQEAYRCAEGRMAQVRAPAVPAVPAQLYASPLALPTTCPRQTIPTCMSRTNLVQPTCNAKQPHRPLRCPPQELLRRHVLKLLRIWRGWFIFSDDYLNGLQVGRQCCCPLQLLLP